MVTVKILGPGCANCKKLESVTRTAATALGMKAEIIKVTDYPEIIAHSILSTPALVMNDKVVCAGRIPTIAEVQAWLNGAAGN